MIKNEKQYKISKKKLKNYESLIEKVNSQSPPDPLKNQLMLTSLTVSKKEIEKELMTYESLKQEKKMVLKERMIGDLPLLLIEYKIILGLTQKEFAGKLGLKEQQLQRYEADNFKSVTFKNLLKFIQLIGLKVKIKETHITSYKLTKHGPRQHSH